MNSGASSVKEMSSNQEGDDEKRRKSSQVCICPFLKKNSVSDPVSPSHVDWALNDANWHVNLLHGGVLCV